MTKQAVSDLLSSPAPKACFAMGERPWGRRALAGLAAMVAVAGIALASPDALATESIYDRQTLADGGIEFVDIGAVVSKEGETKTDFMMRTARYLDAFTRATGHEVCGAITSNERGQWRVRLTTNRSHIACVLVDFEESTKGWNLTDETIHSHPLMQYAFKTNLQDSKLGVAMGNGMPCGNRFRTDDFKFSPSDYENGPGYLVARGRLLYQSQPGERVELGRVDRKTPLEPLLAVGDEQGKVRSISATSSAWTQEDAEGLPRTQCPRPRR